mgnify:CR=1 FL=1
MRFDELDLEDEILDGLEDMNFHEMTPVQEHTIPVILEGRDIIGCAQTGTGKTAAYTLPLLNKLLIEGNPDNVVKSLIIVPTRELAQQIDQQFQGFSYYAPLSTTVVYGGGDGKGWDIQKNGMLNGADVVIATPGRMIAHLQNSGVDLSHVEYLILDEADRMLDMGFSDDIMKIISYMPAERQTIMFSATLPPKIRELAKTILRNPAEVNIAISKPNEAIDQSAYICYERQKLGIIRELFAEPTDSKTIIFSSSKLKVKELAHTLKRMGLDVAAMHSDLEQAQREEVMLNFKNNKVKILVATDIVARGIDIEDIGLVLNYDVPHDPEDYIHRIGRTGRAGNQGTAITFISGAELRRFNWMMRDIKADIKRETLPSPQDIVAMKRAKIKDDLQEIVANESYGDYADIAAELLESYAPDVALGALLRLAFRSELDQSNYPEIRSFSVDRKGKARLFLALGGRDGYTARRIVEMLKRKCGLRDKNIDDVRVFENYSLVSVPFSDAEAVVGQLNASGGRRRIAKIDGSDAENGGGKRRRPATEGRNGGEGASGSESAGEPRSETRGRRKAGQPEGAEEFRSERRPRRETAETADDAGERRSVTRSRKKAENDWNASPAGGNDGFDWEAFQRYDDAAAWEKPKRGGGTRSVRRSGRPVTTGRQAAPKRIAAKGRKR